MSTLRPFEAAQPSARNITSFECDKQQTSDMAFTPRSALDDGMHGNNASAPFSTPYVGSLSIDLPLYSRATLTIESVRDSSHVSSCSTRRLSGSDAGTAHNLHGGSQTAHLDSRTVGHVGQASHSPRKSLPSHWLSKGSGPNLATAKRAKERSHRKDSQHGSPIETKTIHAARSSVDIGNSYGVESPTYLTKEALAAVENDIASPTTTYGPNKLRRSPSKPSWRSPTASPLRSSPGQQTAINAKSSPSRSALLNLSTASSSHSRGPSSVAASCGTFHTANESPVRSPSGTELSFQSAPEHIEDTELPHLKLDADSELLQPSQHRINASPPKQQAATVGNSSQPKPKLALHIPGADSIANADSSVTLVSTAGSSATNTSSSSPEHYQPVSRIPRVTGSIKSGSAYSATRSSTLKQTKSARSSAAKSNFQQNQIDKPHQVPLPKTHVAQSVRHVRTVDSSGTTPMLSHHSVQETHRLADTQDPGSMTRLTTLEQLNQPASGTERTGLTLQGNPVDLPEYSGNEQSSRATSATTIKAPPMLRDPVLSDSAIIYSRKKGNDLGIILGTTSCPSMLDLRKTIVMMAQTLDLTVGVGNLDMCDAIKTFEYAAPASVSPIASSVRGRSDRYVPEMRRPTGSQHSLQSGPGSELRATAPNFVPQPVLDKPTEIEPTPTLTPPQFEQAPWFPLDMSGFDMHGIPWFYYMYPVQFAYDQGFRNGRIKSPRKVKTKKRRHLMSSLLDAQESSADPGSHASEVASAVPPPAIIHRRLASSELMPPPPIPVHGRQQGSIENSLRGGNRTKAQDSEVSRNVHDSDIPFARQLDVIAQQDVLCNNTNANRSRDAIVNLTDIENVSPYHGSRNAPYTNYHTVSMRHGRYHHRHAGNGLYNGRGSGGVPMYATTPFPDPSPPQGRPPVGAGGTTAIVGTEACGLADVVLAAELGGGMPCNTCAPDH
ncbi:hypothetical protein T440DRAFT_523330 [Plenodomus tracheiphilus IPT5]|uniref:Uncharacterized protein n=1 Tax=Plenodomus tracheiphilus IPT5 TaxID=1408161 RepID=A0A6A7AN22_9PLEO|nr:hypothetical protein T440DRAFT_523330 [Plenodomus tracheiphilus IPT5]